MKLVTMNLNIFDLIKDDELKNKLLVIDEKLSKRYDLIVAISWLAIFFLGIIAGYLIKI